MTGVGWRGAVGGCLLLGLGLVFLLGGLDLGVGTARRLGSGAFPALAGGLLAALALAVIVDALLSRPEVAAPDWLSAAAIAAALAAFALAAPRLGLIPAIFLTCVVASLPDRSLSPLGKIALGIAVAAGCWALFIVALGLPFTAFRGV